MKTVQLACQAMATRFEFILHGEDERSLRAAGEEVFEEIIRLERELGFYQSASEISRLNQQAAHQAVRVSPMLFELIERSLDLTAKTSGAFDVTVGPLMHCWGLAGGEGRFPSDDELAQTMKLIGPNNIVLDRSDYSIRYAIAGTQIDLGSIGKGYALDVAAEWLRDAGIESALVHGGTSTTYAIGSPPDQDAWKIAIVRPEDGPVLSQTGEEPEESNILATVDLRDSSLSISAVWGKSFESDGQIFGHVVDPRTGRPVNGAYLAAVVSPSATDTDALATALLTMGSAGQLQLAEGFPDIKTLVAEPEGESDYRVTSCGIAVG